MRHRVDHKKLGRTSSHRKAMLSNMVTSLFDKERITTTEPKAKEARRHADRLVTRAKRGYAAYQEFQSLKDAGKEAEAKQKQAEALAHWRQAGRMVRNQSVLKKLFDDIAPQYMDRDGGYTRILRVGNRQGDNAVTVMLELVGTEVTSAPKARKKGKKAEEEAKAGKKKAKTKEKVEAKGEKKKGKAKKEEETAEAEAKAETEAEDSAPEEEESQEGSEKSDKDS